MSAVAQQPSVALPTVAPYRSTPWIAFGALMLRDLTVLRKNFVEFVLRTVMQPLLFVFVFTYVFPQIGQGVGGSQGEAEFASILVAGVIAIACIFQGIQAVALPLVQEFGYTREIEDRVMAAARTERIRRLVAVRPQRGDGGGIGHRVTFVALMAASNSSGAISSPSTRWIPTT